MFAEYIRLFKLEKHKNGVLAPLWLLIGNKKWKVPTIP
jgi:hypothetical protein